MQIRKDSRLDLSQRETLLGEVSKLLLARSVQPTINSPPINQTPPSTRLWGLLKRKERWGLSWRGCFLLVLLVLGFAFLTLWRTHPFLALTKPVDAEFLVVEGWIPGYTFSTITAEFSRKHYQGLLVTGGPMVPDGFLIEQGDSFAQHTAGRLKQLGVKPDLIETVPAPNNGRDRTYAAAVALRNWFKEKGIHPKAINVVTLGVHARRSRLLAEKAFQGQARIGIIAIENRTYDARHWWHSSEGVKEVISEGAAYLYARFFFHPSD